MSKKNKKRREAGQLKSRRLRAEALLQKSPRPDGKTPDEDVLKLVHELQVHQVELEMQNEELRRTHLELTQSRDRFSDLYDFAPVGYLTINAQGIVLEANLTAAKMLGVVRNHLVAQSFSRFIGRASQDIFDRHRRVAFSGDNPHVCQLALRKADGSTLPVHLESLPVARDAARIRRCRLALVDITDLKRTEAALNEARLTLEEKVSLRTAELAAANAQLEQLLTSSPAIIYSCKASNHYAATFVSKNVRKQLGYDAQEFLEDSGFWAAHIHPEDKHAIFDRLSRLSKQGRESLEYRFQHRDGTYRWMHDELTLLRNKTGQPQQIVGCWIDVTERKQSDETRAQLAAIVESSEDAIISRSLDDIVISWNLGSERLLGYSAAEIVGRPHGQMVPPERKEELGQIRGRILQGKPTEHFETVQVAKGGRKIEVSCTMSPIKDSGGKIIGMSSILRDISRQKWAETTIRRSAQTLADFFTEAPLGLLWVGPDGRILRANQALGTLLGRKGEDLFGRQWSEFSADPEVVSDMLDRLAGKESLHDHRARLQHKDRSLRQTLIDANGLWENGKLVHSHWFIRDVTERVELEKELLNISDQERRRIGQDLHDDLCQQLTGIEFLSRALERRLQMSVPDEAAQAKEIGRLMRQSITHARELAYGMFPLQLHREGLAGALRELAFHTQRLFQVDCRFRGQSSDQIHDRAAQTNLYRIAQEAVRNAVKHGKARRIAIDLRTSEKTIVLRVRDNGAGLPLKLPKGKGLGLRIMGHRARLLGGSILVRRSRAGGTTVLCSIPEPGIRPSAGKNV
jgi:PAS domain S-box-containing protein